MRNKEKGGKEMKRDSKIFKNYGRWIVFTYLVGLLSGATIEYLTTPYIIPWINGLLVPRGSLFVSVKHMEEPEKEVSGGELSLLILMKPGGEPVDEATPKEGWHKWDNIEPGWYVVKAYINDMYVGETDEFEIHRREKRREEIITIIAQSIIKIKVVSGDEATPVEDARVEILSHLGVKWRNYQTDSVGETPNIWLTRTTEEKEYYSIYIHPPEGLKELQMGSVDKFKVDKSRISYTIMLPYVTTQN